MLTLVMDILIWLLSTGKWTFQWRLIDRPKLANALSRAIDDGIIDNLEMAEILKAIRKEL